jgi:hypothetical protein
MAVDRVRQKQCLPVARAVTPGGIVASGETIRDEQSQVGIALIRVSMASKTTGFADTVRTARPEEVFVGTITALTSAGDNSTEDNEA